jgi:prepilin-type N-terminal cleavage/methylation domain-containing protein
MKTQANRSRNDENGFTLVEVMVATMLVAIFFASIFELNAVCLRYMDASKESLAALQSVQDRSEALRNLAFSDLTTTAFVRDNVMPANYTPPDQLGVKPPTSFSKKATEVVKISKCTIPPTLPPPGGYTQFTRLPNGTVTVDSLATDLATAQMVKVDVSVTWNMTMGGRPRVEQTSSLVSNGTKK